MDVKLDGIEVLSKRKKGRWRRLQRDSQVSGL